MDELLATLHVSRHEDGPMTIALIGEVDLSNAKLVEQQIVTASHGEPRVLMDLRELQYLDSQGIRMLYDLASSFARTGTDLAVLAPAGSIAGDVIQMTGLGLIIESLGHSSVIEG
jgi:anti-anti-sigma factor